MITSNGAANAGISDDQEQQHHHNQHISVGRQDSQTSPLTATPHCSPEQILDGVQYAQHQTMVDASSSDQAAIQQQQHLQPVPQRPLFDDATPSLLAQQHAAMMVQQSSSSTMQQQQQLNEQPMAMLNTPILFTNNTTTGTAATGETSPMTTIKKQGRFRVVKGVTNDISAKMTLPPLSSENSNSTTVGDDRNAIVNSSNDAAGNPEISPQSQPVSTIKKGRFLVKKASANNNDANANLAATAAAAAHSGESDVELSPETVISFTTKGEAAVDANVGIESSSLTPDVSNMNNKPAGAAKQKGRFLVKTGVESVAVVAAVGGGGTEVSSTDVLSAKAPEAADTKATENLPASSVDVKKKGRFVVKTGGGTGITVSTDGTAATNNVLSPMTPASGIVHQSNVANVQVASNNQQDSNLPSAAEVISVANTGVDASVQTMTTMASTLTAIPATMTTQNAMQQQNHQHTDSQTSILQVPSATSSIGSSSSVGCNYQHHQQQQHQNLPQAPINDNDAYLQLPPVTHRRVLTDAITGSPTKANGTVVCGTSLGATGGGWMGGKSNGRMIGGGGVGKVLHYIDTIRTEVVEADRSIAALQSDNRHLRDKNKELEAKNKDLERRLGEEKRLRQKVEDKYTSLLQRAHQEMIPITVPPPPDRGNDRRYSTPPLPPFDRVNSNTSAITEEFPIDNQKRYDRICSNTEEFPSDVVIENQKQQPNRTHTGLMVEPIIIPLSRSNSPVISIMKSSHKPTYLSSNTVPDSSTIGAAKLKANIFDPLGVESTSTTAESSDHGGATQNNIVASTSASDASPQLNNNTVDRTKKHFDPLGTPESRATINSNDGLPPPLLLDGGLSQTSPTKCVDDPFDEIVRRVPHNHLQDYD